MACKYMIFLPVFIVFIIHRIVFSSYYQNGKNSNLLLTQIQGIYGKASSRHSDSAKIKLGRWRPARMCRRVLEIDKQANKRRMVNSREIKMRVYAVNEEPLKRFYRHYIIKYQRVMAQNISPENCLYCFDQQLFFSLVFFINCQQ